MSRSRYIKRHRSIQPLLRAVTVIASISILVTGVTFASLQSRQAVLAGSSIQTATADLKIGTTTTNFGSSHAGFAFSDVVPGAAPAEAANSNFFLKNFGTPVLDLKVAVSSDPANPASVDLGKVYLIITRTDTGAVQKLSVSSLVGAYAAGGIGLTDDLAGGATARYAAQVAMDVDAFTGPSAEIAGIDIVFTGNAVTE